MSKNRSKTGFIHIKDGISHSVSKCKKTNKLFIIGTDEEVSGKVVPKNRVKGYDFKKPFIAQDLGDEWDDYAWSADDF